MGARPLIAEGGALHDAEAMLLVDDGKGQLGDLDAFLDDRVRADDDVHLSSGQHEAHVVLHALREASQQQSDRDRALTNVDGHDVLSLVGGYGAPKQPRDGQEMLLG